MEWVSTFMERKTWACEAVATTTCCCWAAAAEVEVEVAMSTGAGDEAAGEDGSSGRSGALAAMVLAGVGGCRGDREGGIALGLVLRYAESTPGQGEPPCWDIDRTIASLLLLLPPWIVRDQFGFSPRVRPWLARFNFNLSLLPFFHSCDVDV